jgi:aspartyl-tRNA(Asn)/glutamyl-tRNA(Gln) amidotransferase subunit A
MNAIHELSLTALAHALQTQQLSARQVAEHFLMRARQHAASHAQLASDMAPTSTADPAHPSCGAFLSMNEAYTLAQADASDQRLQSGQARPLEGVPIAHKDIFVTQHFPTTAGSKILAGYRSPFDATVVARLNEAGMVNLGKLNCDEFAMGSANENSAFGVVHNPWDHTRIAGGSSGGSAAAVAMGLTPAATGTDTGGSIRQPAAFCGITGIKPTYGRASRYGMIAYASSLDQAGPMARSAEDCATLLSAMCGPDVERDSTSLDVPQEDYCTHLSRDIQGLRIGVPKEFFAKGLADDVRDAVQAALATLVRMGAQLVEIELPKTELSIPVYYILAPAEASSNLSRFDGVKFGYRTKEFKDLDEMYQKTRSEGFGAEVKRRIMVGAYVLSHGYYDAYYVQAQKIRRMISEDFQRAFSQCDVIAGPVAPTVAWRLGEKSSDPLSNYLADIFTLPASLAGLPGMSVPCGFGEGHMPVGLQLIGNYLKESQLLNVAHRFQGVSDWHTQRPGSPA